MSPFSILGLLRDYRRYALHSRFGTRPSSSGLPSGAAQRRNGLTRRQSQRPWLSRRVLSKEIRDETAESESYCRTRRASHGRGSSLTLGKKCRHHDHHSKRSVVSFTFPAC